MKTLFIALVLLSTGSLASADAAQEAADYMYCHDAVAEHWGRGYAYALPDVKANVRQVLIENMVDAQCTRTQIESVLADFGRSP